MSTIVFGSCGLSVRRFLLLRFLWSGVEYRMTGSGYPPLPNDYDGFSCGAHKSVFMSRTVSHRPLIACFTSRDYGCLTYE